MTDEDTTQVETQEVTTPAPKAKKVKKVDRKVRTSICIDRELLTKLQAKGTRDKVSVSSIISAALEKLSGE